MCVCVFVFVCVCVFCVEGWGVDKVEAGRGVTEMHTKARQVQKHFPSGDTSIPEIVEI